MKVAVYTIAKNESQFLKRWHTSSVEADQHVILDTGSQDDTAQVARDLGIRVGVLKLDQFRFDYARNACLGMVGDKIDVCISLDVDEILCPNWRQRLEEAASANPAATRLRYLYHWNAHRPADPRVEFMADKIHARHGYRWTRPAHEALTASGREQIVTAGLRIEHHPDPSKSRSSYLELLELGAREDPGDDRCSHYLGREYYFRGQPHKAIQELQRHLSIKTSTWNMERAASAKYIGCSLRLLGNLKAARFWLEMATSIAPGSRDVWLDLATFEYENQQWDRVVEAVRRLLLIQRREMSYTCTNLPWGPRPYEIGAEAARNMGDMALWVQWSEQRDTLAA